MTAAVRRARMRAAISRTAAGTAAVLTASLLPLAVPAAAGAPASPSATCPPAVPVSELAVGQQLSGLTVDRGTTPAPFAASVIGVLDSGIAPGVDMVLVEADSPAIRAAGGIWAGMSGSPVHAADGRLVGAVSYGLSYGSSPVAGITPASDMYALLAAGAPATAPEDVPLPRSLQQRLVDDGLATRAEAASGLSSLPVPFAVSGLPSGRLNQVSDRITDRLPGARPYAAGSVTAGSTGDPATVVPGGNFASALSYGDVTVAATGTTTAVCGDQVLAFGHPVTFDGRTTHGLHGATALYVQPDSLGSPYKVSTLGGVVGTATQDRLAGVRGSLGSGPATVPIRSSFTSPHAGGRTGTTQVAWPDFVPNAGLVHTLAGLDRVADRIGGGVVRLSTTVRGTRADGTPWTLSRSDVYADEFDVTFSAALAVADPLAAIAQNRHEEVTIDSVDLDGSVDDTYRDARIVGLQARNPAGAWSTVTAGSPVQVVAGSSAQLRALLRPYRSSATVSVPVSVVVPHGTVGAVGSLRVTGGSNLYDDSQAGTDFPGLLASLQDQPAANSVVADLLLAVEGPDGYTERELRGQARTDDVVLGELYASVEVVAPQPARAAVVEGNTWLLRSGLDEGEATAVAFGRSGDQQVMGDWNGDGRATPGVFRNGIWYLRNGVTGAVEPAVSFGRRGDVAVVGDWDGDGDDDLGVYRAGHWYLTTRLGGPVTSHLGFGSAAQRPVVGDWDGDGDDDLGVFAGGAWQVRTSLSSGSPVRSFQYGRATDVPVAGDWDADGRDGIGVYRAGQWVLRDTATGGAAAHWFGFGAAASRPLVWR